MVNWDQKQTTLSDEEVIFEEQQGKLYYIQYIIEGSDDFLTIQRHVLKLFGDSAICKSNDERFAHLREKKPLFLFVVV
jgi:valyl-tRNA synthetase